MTGPLSEEYLAEVEVALAAYRKHAALGFACCSAHGPADAASVLLAEVRRLRGIVDADIAAANLPPSVERMVASVREAGVHGPCWVVAASLGRMALIRTGEAGLEFVAASRRLTLSDATGMGLLILGDEEALPPYVGGGRDWEWTEGDTGRPVRLAGGAR